MGARRLGSAVTALAACAGLAGALAARPASAEPVYDCDGVGIVTDANGNAVLSPDGQVSCIYTYDASVTLAGRTEAATQIGTPTTTSYTYDTVYDRVDSITDTGSLTTTYQYDSGFNGERLHTTTAPGDQVTTYQYDPVNRAELTQVTDPSGNITTYHYYDGTSQLHEIDEPLSQTYTYTYYDSGPDAGLLYQVTDPAGDVTTYTYDSDQRLSGATTVPLSGPDRVTTYIYDGAGQLETVDSPSGTTNYYYDVQGLLCSETDPTCATTTYVYDSAGRLTSDGDPGSNVDFIYTSDIPEPGSLILLVSGLGAFALRRRRASG